MYPALENMRHKIFGDRRDQRLALRAAGFDDEAGAARWALSLAATDGPARSQLELVRRIRRARPDLTGATASYIARQVAVRHG